ncbi:MAG TPA: methyl-accepting chemotaxis protein [Synergistaceae bacterium]|nr:methyl-accepting chemotaxis protein [Synergistaceae bacterium]HQF90965.1 methyl-accepting chemotaxis protein [Synergistaceae bacterium]HQH77937.1 methyl-accepting chemotaxis protein [Synergistaceae bacterium]HQK24151.1 methyl-accepting chemotaxis protein [Synergistaceae bacterium]
MSTLRGRLIGVFLTVVLVALGGLGYTAFTLSREALMDLGKKEGVALAKGVAVETNFYVEGVANLLKSVASTPALQSMNWELQRPALESALKGTYAFETIFVLNLSGEARTLDGVTANYGDREYFLAVRDTGKLFVSNPLVSRATGNNVVVFAVPIFGEGNALVGVLASSVNAETLMALYKSVVWGKTGYAFLVGRNGIVAAHPNQEIVGKLNASEVGPSIPEALAGGVRGALAGKSSVVPYEFQGTDRMAAFEPVTATGWGVGLSSPNEEFLGAVNELRTILFLVIGVIVLVVVALSLWLAGSISRPVAAIAHHMEGVASGDLSRRITLSSSLREIRNLVTSLNEMIAAQGRTVASIRDSSREVLEKAESMSAAVEESRAAILEVASMTSRVSDRTQDAAAAIEEANAGIEEVSAGAQAGAHAAVAAGEEAAAIATVARSGGEAMDAMTGEIGQVAASQTRADDAMQQLGKAVTQIGSFVTTITQIADQTNLLALNAAIEAARAGEAGRGFAVVAEEVRKLAEESNRAAHNVGTLINDVSSRTQAALTDNKEASTQLSALVNRSKETRQLILEMVKKVGHITESVQSIAATMEEQSAAAEEMASGMDQVAKSSQEISEAVRTISHSMEEQDAAMEIIAVASEGMVSLSQALESAVEVFKLDESSGVTPHPVAALPGAPRKIPSSGAKERGASTPPKRR